MANLSSTNVNTYLASRSSNASQYASIATDVESSLLSALQSRFNVSTSQVGVINGMVAEQKAELAHLFRTCANFLSASTGRSVTVTTSGFGEQPPGSFSTVGITVTVGISTTIPGGDTSLNASATATYS